MQTSYPWTSYKQLITSHIHATFTVNSLRPSVGNLTIIGPENGLSPGRRQATIWTNAGILSIGPWEINSSEICIGIHTFPFKKIHLKMASAKWRPFCLGLNGLNSDLVYVVARSYSEYWIPWLCPGGHHAIMPSYSSRNGHLITITSWLIPVGRTCPSDPLQRDRNFIILNIIIFIDAKSISSTETKFFRQLGQHGQCYHIAAAELLVLVFNNCDSTKCWHPVVLLPNIMIFLVC